MRIGRRASRGRRDGLDPRPPVVLGAPPRLPPGSSRRRVVRVGRVVPSSHGSVPRALRDEAREAARVRPDDVRERVRDARRLHRAPRDDRERERERAQREPRRRAQTPRRGGRGGGGAARAAPERERHGAPPPARRSARRARAGSGAEARTTRAGIITEALSIDRPSRLERGALDLKGMKTEPASVRAYRSLAFSPLAIARVNKPTVALAGIARVSDGFSHRFRPMGKQCLLQSVGVLTWTPLASKSAKGATDSGSIAPSVPRCQPDTDPRAVRGERPGTGRARRTSRRAVRARLTRPATRRSRGASGARRARTPSARGWAALVARRGPSIGARGGVQRRRHPRETRASRVASLQTRANARVRAGASARGAASHDGRLHRRRRRREDAVDRRPGARALPPGRRRRDARRDAIFFLDNDAVDASRDATPSTKRATRPRADPAPRRR